MPPSWPRHPRCGSHRPIEDVLSPPGLRSPPYDCEEIPVACRTTQSPIGKYVPGANRGHRPGPPEPPPGGECPSPPRSSATSGARTPRLS
ncbi:hypothetical protein BKH32_07710 [Actinomyces oris]|uniref:Uncharacterized protein n=1 Tax=Actinomyces oris TaxID=544580 RepID=A0A1Q8I0H0_9ACTO|nr:hypothetical protein BKH32_07710 [Actinomyces oris]